MAIVDIPEPEKQITLGISSCLLGHKVRYNGGHKRSSFCVNTLDRFFHFEPVCPELAIGLGIPREPIRLVGKLADSSLSAEQNASSAPGKKLNIRVVGTDNAELDVTDDLVQYGRQMAGQLSHISGYILMQKSPSCGMDRVKVYHQNGHPLRESAPGAYAGALIDSCPLLPVEEEGRLHDPVLCENFFTRVYAYSAWQKMVLAQPSSGALVEFHAMHKYMIMAHYPQGYKHLGQIVARGRGNSLMALLEEYFEAFMTALKRRATRKSHTNAMMHILGYVKKSVAGKERNQLLTLIEEYRRGMVPLIAPMTMLRHFIENHGNPYIQKQAYLMPHPDQLGLRNQI